jgi:hypothetical protein
MRERPARVPELRRHLRHRHASTSEARHGQSLSRFRQKRDIRGPRTPAEGMSGARMVVIRCSAFLRRLVFARRDREDQIPVARALLLSRQREGFYRCLLGQQDWGPAPLRAATVSYGPDCAQSQSQLEKGNTL